MRTIEAISNLIQFLKSFTYASFDSFSFHFANSSSSVLTGEFLNTRYFVILYSPSDASTSSCTRRSSTQMLVQRIEESKNMETDQRTNRYVEPCTSRERTDRRSLGSPHRSEETQFFPYIHLPRIDIKVLSSCVHLLQLFEKLHSLLLLPIESLLLRFLFDSLLPLSLACSKQDDAKRKTRDEREKDP